MFSILKKIFNANMSFLIILTAAIFIVYGKSINFELLDLDDSASITDNINYISNIKNIPELFLRDCHYSHEGNYYRPVLSLSFALESVLFGFNTKIYHCTNLMLFIFAFYLFYIFSLKLNCNKNISKFICLIFALHPVLTSEAVYVSTRAESILSIFTAAAFINFINYLKYGKSKYLFFNILFFTAALFTKETAVIMVPMLFMYKYVFLGYELKNKELAKNIFAIFLIIGIYFVLRNISATSANTVALKFDDLKILSLNIFKGMAVYVYKIINPSDVPVILYNISINMKIIAVNIFIFGVIIFIALKKTIDVKILSFSLAWFVLFLLPTFLLKDYSLFFHRLTLPLFGAVTAISFFVTNIIKIYPNLRLYLTVMFFLLFSSFGCLSHAMSDKYKNSEAFWTNAYMDSPEYYQTCASMANIYLKYGKTEEAGVLLRKALSLKFSYRYLISYANLLFLEGNYEESERFYLQLLEDMKGKKELVCYPLSEIYFIRKDYNKALEYAESAYEKVPYNVVYSKQLAKICESVGEYERAKLIYEDLLKFDKKNTQYENNINVLNKKIKEKRL